MWASHLARPSANSLPLNPMWAFIQTSLSSGSRGWRRRKSPSTTSYVPVAHKEGLLGASLESKEWVSLTTCWLSQRMIVPSVGGYVA